MNKIKKLTALMIAVFSLFTYASCGGKVTESIDKTKKQIYIQIYNGGYGVDWINPVVEEFEADYPQYQIVLDPKKLSCQEIETYINVGTEYCAFLGYMPDFHQGMYAGLFADLSDMLEMDVDGNGVTIGDKMLNKEMWLQATTISDKCYALPYGDSITGFVYDHDSFVSRNLLYYAENTTEVTTALTEQGISYHVDGDKLVFDSATGRVNYESGDYILRAGKDGKYGTYDDGQPITESEFHAMVEALSTPQNSHAFIYSGKVIDYTTDIFTGVFAHYEGADNYNIFNSYDGEYTFAGDSQPTTITPQNGYLVYGMDGIQKGFEFYNKYFFDENYTHAQSFISESSHTDAQSYFLLGSAMTSASNPFAGMLVDGVYWEYEARTISQMLEKRNYKDYAYGKRDFRYMLYPDFEGQKDLSKSTMVARDTSSFVINGKMDEELTRMTKLFCAYTLKDKFLRHFTTTNGAVRPYQYTLTEEDRAKMTKFANTCYDIYRDTENISIARPWLGLYSTPMSWATTKGTTNMYYSLIDDLSRGGIYSTLTAARSSINPSVASNPAKAASEGMLKYYQSNWGAYYDAYNEFVSR